MSTLRGYVVRAEFIFRTRGALVLLFAGVRLGLIYASGLFWIVYFALVRPTFEFQHVKYSYFFHLYNFTWRSERAVEIPIVEKVIEQHGMGRVLEVGNVLSHYFEVNHDIVDKYEKSEGVLNQDVVEYQTSAKYDLIVSISTLEHVGWDETPRDPRKVLMAIQNLRRLLSKSGMIMITIPVGQNPELDGLIEQGILRFDQVYVMQKVSCLNRWLQVSIERLKRTNLQNNPSFLLIGIILADSPSLQ